MVETLPPSRVEPDGLYRLSAAQYDEMVASGALGPDDPVELLDGLLIQKMPQNGPHSTTIQKLSRWLLRRCFETHDVRGGMPVRMIGSNRLKPDLAVVAGEPDDYPDQPTAEQVLLAVEVSDKASRQVLDLKRTRYAQSGLEELWIVNVGRRTVEIYRKPSPDGYRSAVILDETEPFAPLFLPEQTLRGLDILPQPR